MNYVKIAQNYYLKILIYSIILLILRKTKNSESNISFQHSCNISFNQKNKKSSAYIKKFYDFLKTIKIKCKNYYFLHENNINEYRYLYIIVGIYLLTGYIVNQKVKKLLKNKYYKLLSINQNEGRKYIPHLVKKEMTTDTLIEIRDTIQSIKNIYNYQDFYILFSPLFIIFSSLKNIINSIDEIKKNTTFIEKELFNNNY